MHVRQLRQQVEKRSGRANMCLADFLSPEADWIGGFAVTTGHGIEQHLARFNEEGGPNFIFRSMEEKNAGETEESPKEAARALKKRTTAHLELLRTTSKSPVCIFMVDSRPPKKLLDVEHVADGNYISLTYAVNEMYA